jgi:hypothetical protein
VLSFCRNKSDYKLKTIKNDKLKRAKKIEQTGAKADCRW